MAYVLLTWPCWPCAATVEQIYCVATAEQTPGGLLSPLILNCPVKCWANRVSTDHLTAQQYYYRFANIFLVGKGRKVDGTKKPASYFKQIPSSSSSWVLRRHTYVHTWPNRQWRHDLSKGKEGEGSASGRAKYKASWVSSRPACWWDWIQNEASSSLSPLSPPPPPPHLNRLLATMQSNCVSALLPPLNERGESPAMRRMAEV